MGFDFADVPDARVPVVKRDVFTLDGEFDIVWEYTCFCAIDPSRRAEYVDVLSRILRKGAELIALFYPLKDAGGGPPFPVERGEVERLLAGRFRIDSEEVPKDSIERRRGFEVLVRARRL